MARRTDKKNGRIERETKKFKVGDKVYIDPGKPEFPSDPMPFTNYMRATITAIDEDWGYWLRVFKSDLPGACAFNVWDDELLPRADGKMKPLKQEVNDG